MGSPTSARAGLGIGTASCRLEVALPHRIALAVLAALVFSAASALAAPGINLNVDDCAAGTPTNVVNEACTTNSGTSFVLIGSVVLPPVTVSHFSGAESILDIQTENNVPVPDWWRADVCRSYGFVPTGDPVAIGGSCPTLWDTYAPAGTTLTAVIADGAPPNRIRFLIDSVLDDATATNASVTGDGTTERSVFRLTVTRIQTVGDGSCIGCFHPACIVLNEINVRSQGQAPENWLRITAAATSRYVTYNGGLASAVCPDDVPVRMKTWGAVKAFYRH
jgi:hypothetical protein